MSAVALPRLVVAAPASGHGKTTVATGLMAALARAGHTVSGHKVGPDYIDPGYHALATGRPGRNLDPHLVGEERLVPMLLHGASGADIAVIEGVMGLYDGRLGTDGFASTAHVATLTRTPVVLVIDVAKLSRSAGAIALGMATFDVGVRVAGVVLNQAGSDRNTAEIIGSLEQTGLPVLGVMPRDVRLSTPSRHLGLVPAAERDGSIRMIEQLGEQVARHLDLDAILEVARSAPHLDAESWSPAREVMSVGASDHRPVVAMAGGRALLAVADDGTGIAPEDQPHVFDRFYRSDRSRTRSSGGTGLGLSIAKAIIDAHDAEVELVSAKDGGTTFIVCFPELV